MPCQKYKKKQSRKLYLDSQKQYNKIRPESDKQYKTARWLHLRELKLHHNPLCEVCMKAGKTVLATLVHHIKPIKDGGSMYDWNNLMSLCSECHTNIHKALGTFKKQV